MNTEARRMMAQSAARAAAEGRTDDARHSFADALAGDVRDVEVLFLGFQFHFRAGEYDQAERLVQRRLDVLGRETRSGEVARAYANLSLIHTFRGTLAAAEQTAHQAIALAREIGHEHELSRGLHNLAMVHEKRGELEQAETVYREALVIAERIGADDLAASKLANLGDVAMLRGRENEAKELWNRAAELFGRLGDETRRRMMLENVQRGGQAAEKK